MGTTAADSNFSNWPPGGTDIEAIHAHFDAKRRGSVGPDEAVKLRQRFANANAGVYVTLHMQRHVTQRAAGQYFDGWIGTVSVGPLREAPASASSTH